MRGLFASPRRRRSLVAAVACAFTLAACGHQASAPPPVSLPPIPTGQLSPLLDDVPSMPRWFTGTDARAHLVYELKLTNLVPAPVTLRSVEVRAAGSGAALVRLEGESLKAATSLIASPDTPTLQLPSSGVGIVWLDIPLARPDAVPAQVTHTVAIDPPDGVPLAGIPLSFTGIPIEVDRRAPVVLAAPVAGSQWAALGSCCDGPHRRALYPVDGQWYVAQRFAVDFNRLEPDNRPGTGDPALPASSPTFGQPVLAVADGTVVVAQDSYPDLNVGQQREEPTPDNAGGNRVILDIGDGRFAVYAHLRAGSVAVRPGERVTSGQRLAEAGSSGTTGGPHLHFQVTDRPSVVEADGMPYVFHEFRVTGQTPPLADVLPYYDTFDPIPITTANAGERHDELPLGRDVVAFPG